MWRTDIFVARGRFFETAMSRARLARIGTAAVRVLAPEDIILLKLIAHRRKDLADIEELFSTCAGLDRAHLRKWAASLGVSERLEEFRPSSA